MDGYLTQSGAKFKPIILTVELANPIAKGHSDFKNYLFSPQ